MKKRWLCLALLWISGVVNALQELTPPPTLAYKKLSLSGYVDGSYNYLQNSNQFFSGINDRVFDLNEDGFTLQQAAATLAYTPPRGLGAVLNVIVGSDANELAPVGWNSEVFGKGDIGLDIPQVYMQYAYDSYNFKIGELVTLSGLENYDYTKDTNFSRSILVGYAQPGSNVGMRGTKNFADHWKVIIGVNNGWNTIERIVNQKMLELGLGYTHPKSCSLAINLLNGQQYLTGDVWSRQTAWRSLIDIYGTFYVNQTLSLAANFDYAIQTKALLPNGTIAQAKWTGIAGYVNYIFSEKFRTSVRAEVFEDPNGYRTGVKQNWHEVTMTLAYLPLKSVEIRTETRHDFSNQDAFFKKNKLNTSKNQQSYALEMFYKFDV